MIELDGSIGGGQMLRTALGLSILTQRPFRMRNIRLNRQNPGLKPQHIAAIKACAELSNAYVQGSQAGSLEIEYIPRGIKNRQMVISTGTAASTTLVLQSLLIPSLFLQTTLTVKGGTDVPFSMPANYLGMVLLPVLRDYADIDMTIENRGYYPVCGGVITVSTKPKFRRIDFDSFSKFHQYIFGNPSINLSNTGKLLSINGISHASKNLQAQSIAEHQAQLAEMSLKQFASTQVQREYAPSLSEGFGIVLVATHNVGVESEERAVQYRLACSALCAKNTRPEIVSQQATEKMKLLIQSSICVDEYLQDNLIPYIGLFGGRIKTGAITNHTKANIEVCSKFLDVEYNIEKISVPQSSTKNLYSEANFISVLSSSTS